MIIDSKVWMLFMLLMRKKYNTILLGFLLCGFILTSWLSFNLAHNSISKETVNPLSLTQDTVYSEIQEDLMQPIYAAKNMANNTFLRRWAVQGESKPEPLIEYLKYIKQDINIDISFFASSQSGVFYHDGDGVISGSENFTQQQWFIAAINSPHDYVINIDQHHLTPSKYTLFINYKVVDAHENIIGIAGVGITLSKLKKIITQYQRHYHRKIYFIDEQGSITLQASSEPTKLNNIHQNDELLPYLDNIFLKQQTAFEFEYNSQPAILHSRWVEQLGWYLIIEHHNKGTSSLVSQEILSSLLLSGSLILLVLCYAHRTFDKYQRQIEAIASFDKLSNALNRQAFDPLLTQHVIQAQQKQQRLSLILLDIDHFKHINDSYGHLAGDKIIQQVALTCQQVAQGNDVVCRWGGEEFIVLLPHSDLAKAQQTAEQIKHQLKNMVQVQEIAVTVSFGVAQYQIKESDESFISRADNALLQAKRLGRNRITLAS